MSKNEQSLSIILFISFRKMSNIESNKKIDIVEEEKDMNNQEENNEQEIELSGLKLFRPQYQLQPQRRDPKAETFES